MVRTVLVALVVAACTPSYAESKVPADAAVTRASCVEDGKPFDPHVLGERVAFLASERLGGRVPGSKGDTAARAFFIERFKCLGLTPGANDGSYEQPFVGESNENTANVIGYIPGTTKDIIVIGAHHDHIGSGLLGANDNASGTVALLAIAQAIKQRGVTPKRTIVFVAFGAEEQGMVGSHYFVAHAPPPLAMKQVVQYINLDMVGSYSSKRYVLAMGTFPKLAARRQLDHLVAKFPKLRVGLGGRARASDFLPFCKLGIPYVFFWTPDARCYHEECDTAEKIDRKRMADITALADALAWSLSETDTDLAAARAKLGCGL